ncbi:MAG: methyltransferase domain-containing protein [Caldithrix sp.]|nr:methyltransferase domain-containing protein [Caldithrix sp.]
MESLASDQFGRERQYTQRFFNVVSIVYPIIEWHLFPEYKTILQHLDLPTHYSVLDIATGSGILAGAFAERGHAVTGIDFSRKLLKRAKKQFPQVWFEQLDLIHLDQYADNHFDVISMGYFLHGLSVSFRHFILKEVRRISKKYVLVFDYCCTGNWFIRLIEWLEGSNYPLFIALNKQNMFEQNGLQIVQDEQTSGFGQYWLLKP